MRQLRLTNFAGTATPARVLTLANRVHAFIAFLVCAGSIAAADDERSVDSSAKCRDPLIWGRKDGILVWSPLKVVCQASGLVRVA